MVCLIKALALLRDTLSEKYSASDRRMQVKGSSVNRAVHQREIMIAGSGDCQ